MDILSEYIENVSIIRDNDILCDHTPNAGSFAIIFKVLNSKPCFLVQRPIHSQQGI